MKSLVTIALLLAASSTISASTFLPSTDKEKEKKEVKNEEKKKNLNSPSKNFHTIKKWKMRIEYTNGDIISKTIEVGENSSLSAMETAFIEAEKYIKTLGKVKGYEVSPVSTNRFVLLANK